MKSLKTILALVTLVLLALPMNTEAGSAAIQLSAEVPETVSITVAPASNSQAMQVITTWNLRTGFHTAVDTYAGVSDGQLVFRASLDGNGSAGVVQHTEITAANRLGGNTIAYDTAIAVASGSYTGQFAQETP